MDLALLWLWCRMAAAVLIGPLAWEHPYAMNAALKTPKKKKKKKKKKVGFKHGPFWLQDWMCSIFQHLSTFSLFPCPVPPVNGGGVLPPTVAPLFYLPAVSPRGLVASPVTPSSCESCPLQRPSLPLSGLLAASAGLHLLRWRGARSQDGMLFLPHLGAKPARCFSAAQRS